MENKTSFQLVSEMNLAFNNPKGSYDAVDIDRLLAQVQNVVDECNEFVTAAMAGNLIGMRDALCDIQVFAMGAQHLMGVNGDHDMKAVVAGVMTRFIKDADDLTKTIEYHAAKGVTKVYFEGEFPKMIMKSAEDQPDAPKGKFLKSASYQDTVFPAVVVPQADAVVTARVYLNSNDKEYYRQLLVEPMSLIGDTGDSVALLKTDGTMYRAWRWDDDEAAWRICPDEVIQ